MYGPCNEICPQNMAFLFMVQYLYFRILMDLLFCLPHYSKYMQVQHGYGSIPIDTFLVGWTSIYQLFWCSPGVQGFDPSPHDDLSIYVHGLPLPISSSYPTSALVEATAPCALLRSSSNAWLDFLGKRLLHKVWSEMGHTPERLNNIWQILAQKKIHHWMLGAPLFQRIYHCYHFEVLQQWNSRTHAVAHASGCSWLCWYAHQGETDMTLDG